MAKFHGEIALFKGNEEMDGVVEKVTTGAATSILNRGIGVHHENGW